jgi:hypothetical protein
MRRSIRLAAAMAALFLVVPVASVQATPPMAVSFEVPTNFDESTGVSSGTFTATGGAVDDGLICPTGDVTDTGPAIGAGFQSERAVNLQVIKEFTCNDRSGSFLVKLQVRIVFGDPAVDNFRWVVVGGTGAYGGLHGSGSGYGDYSDPSVGVIDVYDGGVHID